MSDLSSDWLDNNYPDDLIKEDKFDEFEEWLNNYENEVADNDSNEKLLFIAGFVSAFILLFIINGLLSIFGIDIFAIFDDFGTKTNESYF